MVGPARQFPQKLLDLTFCQKVTELTSLPHSLTGPAPSALIGHCSSSSNSRMLERCCVCLQITVTLTLTLTLKWPTTFQGMCICDNRVMELSFNVFCLCDCVDFFPPILHLSSDRGRRRGSPRARRRERGGCVYCGGDGR